MLNRLASVTTVAVLAGVVGLLVSGAVPRASSAAPYRIVLIGAIPSDAF